MQKLVSESNKENINAAYESDEVAVPIKGIPTLEDDLPVKKTEQELAAPTIKEGEAVEPLLQENPNRFVLFPIKYHEVWSSNATQRVKCLHETREADMQRVDMADVQESGSLVLDRRRNRPIQGLARLEQASERRRALLRQPRPRLLRGLGWHRQREPCRAFQW